MSAAIRIKGRNVIMVAAVVTLGLSGYAIAQPSPGYGPGPHHGPGGMVMGPGGHMGPGWHHGSRFGDYYSGQQVPREKVEAAVRGVLARAVLGSAWRGHHGIAHIPILLDGRIIGNLWQHADLTKLEVGAYWASSFGQQVELIEDTRVVGTVWVSA